MRASILTLVMDFKGSSYNFKAFVMDFTAFVMDLNREKMDFKLMKWAGVPSRASRHRVNQHTFKQQYPLVSDQTIHHHFEQSCRIDEVRSQLYHRHFEQGCSSEEVSSKLNQRHRDSDDISSLLHEWQDSNELSSQLNEHRYICDWVRSQVRWKLCNDNMIYDE